MEKATDARGFFGRVFCEAEFAAAGLETRYCQVNNSLSAKAGTLRGLHYQLPPATEVKVVRCLRGSVWDCIVDLRPSSPTFMKWYGTELNAENRMMLYVPRGFAHGFITGSDDTEMMYMVSAPYTRDKERGLRWNDPRIGIEWPREPAEISERDAAAPDFDWAYHGVETFR